MFSVYLVNKHGSLLYQTDFVSRAGVSTNDKIRWASTFHTVSAMAAEISPLSVEGAVKGISQVNFGSFNLHCKQTPTGLQILLLTSTSISKRAAEDTLGLLYIAYVDHVLKNPFYTLDMPIKLVGFSRAVRQVVVG